MLLMDCLTPVLVDGLFATLGINNRKAKQLVNCQNPFPGLFFFFFAAANQGSQQEYGSQRRFLGKRQ